MLRRQWLAMLAVAVLALAGCDGGNNDISGSGRFNVTGSWTGNAAIGQYSNFRLQITQASNGSLVGTWTALVGTGGGAGALDQSGNLTGTNNANAVSLTFQGIGGTFAGTATSTSRMQGTLAVTGNTSVAMTFTK